MADHLEVDDVATVAGLTQQTALNGQVVRVVCVGERVTVISASGKRFRVKPENLEAAGIVKGVPKLRAVVVTSGVRVRGWITPLSGQRFQVPERTPVPHSLALTTLRSGEQVLLGFAERQLWRGRQRRGVLRPERPTLLT